VHPIEQIATIYAKINVPNEDANEKSKYPKVNDPSDGQYGGQIEITGPAGSLSLIRFVELSVSNYFLQSSR
jgi:hypothetical protein